MPGEHDEGTERDRVIIETSVLFITLAFIILQTWCQQGSLIPPWVIPFFYAVGFMFAVAALLAVVHLFFPPTRLGEVLVTAEFTFFFVGLSDLAAVFLLVGLPYLQDSLAIIGVAIAFMVVIMLIVTAKKRRQAPS